MRILSKTFLGIGAAATAAVTFAAPAGAQRYPYRDYDDGIDLGDVVAGIAIVGGVAALISALDNDDYRYGSRYGTRRGDARRAVDACARAARQEVRYGGDRARVGEIYDVDRAGRGYYRVRGTLNVRDNQYGYGGYRRGYDYDRVRFSCTAGYGRVVDLDIGGRDLDRYGDYRRYDRRW